jgi:hypothetical protein
MALVQQPTSAANLLALLEEDDDALRLYALQALNRVVHDFWFQIASALAAVEAFYEDEGFSHRGLAALVASKVAGGLLLCARAVRARSQARRLMQKAGCTYCMTPGPHRRCFRQVFYHLGELDDALTYALGAGALFDTSEQSEYVQTILCTDPRLVFTSCHLRAACPPWLLRCHVTASCAGRSELHRPVRGAEESRSRRQGGRGD